MDEPVKRKRGRPRKIRCQVCQDTGYVVDDDGGEPGDRMRACPSCTISVPVVGAATPIYTVGGPSPENRKAEDWQQEDPALPWQNDVRCRNCNSAMWVREPEKHDICEECGYLLRDQMQDIASRQRNQISDRLIDPFTDSIFAGQSGSLPNSKE